MAPERPPSLAQRSLTAVFWGGGGAVLRLALQVGTQIALARILGPQAYGVFAVGATVIGFSIFLADIGLAYGLIQKADVGPEDVRFVFTWQVVLGGLVMLLVAALATPLAGFFGEPRAGAVLQLMSLLCLLNALAAPSLNLLKRQLNFRSIQIAQVLSYVAGYLLCGVPLALEGAGYWSLVIAWLVQSLLNAVLLYRATRHPLRPLFWYGEAQAQARYAVTVLATNLTNWFIGNIDRVVVARMLGSREIGLYATSYNLLYNPSATLLGVVQPVFFAASARISGEPARIAQGYLALIGFLGLFLLPLYAGLAVLADCFVLVLYGNQWVEAASLIAPLALAMPLFILFGLTTPLLWTSDNARREFSLQLPVALVWLLACAVAAQVSVTAVAWTVLALCTLRTGLVVRAVCRAMQMPALRLWPALRGGLIVSVVCAAAVVLARWALPGAAPAWLHLAVGCGSGAAAWLLLVWGIPGLVGADAVVLLRQLALRAPAGMARYLDAIDRRNR